MALETLHDVSILQLEKLSVSLGSGLRVLPWLQENWVLVLYEEPSIKGVSRIAWLASILHQSLYLGMLVAWNVSGLEFWCLGMMVPWDFGALGCWCLGIMVPWDVGALGYWCLAIILLSSLPSTTGLFSGVLGAVLWATLPLISTMKPDSTSTSALIWASLCLSTQLLVVPLPRACFC